jgi:hypothetical protein
MKLLPIIPILILYNSFSANAQVKVAQYCFGKNGTKDYENISFWTKNDKRTHIEYSYGSNPKKIMLQFLGKSILNEKNCFKVQFPNKYILFIIPNETVLQIRDEKGKYTKTFTWEYEGPVNGIGTFCHACAENEEVAMEIVKKNFLQ